MKTLFLLLLCCTLRAFSQPQQKNEAITVDGRQREFVTYIPAVTDPAYKMPVIISLHGRFGTGPQMIHFADFRTIAEKEKFIIVCPSGIDKSWNAGGPTPANRKGIDDVKFIDELITYILNTYHADAKRVYVTGMSNGGFMASRLACELNNRIAAIAVVGASMNHNMSDQPKKAIPVMYIQGTEDPLVPYIGGTMRNSKVSICGHEEVLKLWAGVDHCDAKPVVTNLTTNVNDGTSVAKEEYVNKETGVKVIGYTLTGGGHTWPGGTQYLPKFLIGPVSHNLNACQVILDFFKGIKLVD